MFEEVKAKGKAKVAKNVQKKATGGKRKKEVDVETEPHEPLVENVASSTRSSRRNKKEPEPKQMELNDENAKEEEDIEMEEAEVPKKKPKPKKKAAAKSKKVTMQEPSESDNQAQLHEEKEEKDTPKNGASGRGKNKRQEVGGDFDTEESPKRARGAGKKAASKKTSAKPKKPVQSDADETDELSKVH